MNGSGDMKGLKVGSFRDPRNSPDKTEQKQQIFPKSRLPDIRMPNLIKLTEHWFVTHADRSKFDDLY